MIDDKEYAEFCLSRMNKNLSESEMAHNCIYGLFGEGGEAVDLLKKVYFHGHVFSPELRRKLLLELGDTLFYLTTLAKLHGMSLEEIMTANVEKLTKRYPIGFDIELSKKREE